MTDSVFSWSWPTGCLVLGVSLLTYIVFGIEPWLWWTAPVFALIATGLLASRRVREALPGELRVPRPRLHAGFVLFTFLLACFCLLHITAGAARPIVEGDEGNIWSLKAKSLLLDYYLGDFALAQHWNLHPDYPLLNPLLQAWVHSQFGQIEHFAARFLVRAAYSQCCLRPPRRCGPGCRRYGQAVCCCCCRLHPRLSRRF